MRMRGKKNVLDIEPGVTVVSIYSRRTAHVINSFGRIGISLYRVLGC